MYEAQNSFSDTETTTAGPQNGYSASQRDARFGGGQRENMGSAEAWLSLAAGAGLVWGAWRSRNTASLPLAAAGASLLYRGSTRHCPLYSAIGVDHSGHKTGPDAVGVITIDKPPHELYQFWRDLSNAPRFMSFVESVDILDDKRSRWRGKQIGKYAFDYDAEITEDIPDSGFRWQSIEGAPMKMRGSVRFAPAPANRGTTVIASVVFGRSGGSLRGKLAGPVAHYTIHKDLMRFKQLMEAGEIATAEGPSGPTDKERTLAEPSGHDVNRGAMAEEYGASWS